MKKSLLITSLFAVALAGCNTIMNQNTPVGKFTLADAEAASALAAQHGDKAAQVCYDFIANDIKANGNAVVTPGFLYLNEVRRTAPADGRALADACGGVLPISVSF